MDERLDEKLPGDGLEKQTFTEAENKLQYVRNKSHIKHKELGWERVRWTLAIQKAVSVAPCPPPALCSGLCKRTALSIFH